MSITEQDLRNYRKLKIEMDNLEESIMTMERKLTSARVQLPKRCSSGTKLTLEDNIDKLNRLRDKYIHNYAKLFEKIFYIEEFIEALEDPTTRMIFRLRYIEGLEWEKICVKVHYRWRKVHSLHRKVLDELEEGVE